MSTAVLGPPGKEAVGLTVAHRRLGRMPELLRTGKIKALLSVSGVGLMAIEVNHEH